MRNPEERLIEQVARWGVLVDEVRETPTSLIAFGRRDTSPVVLKLVKAPGDEWASGEVVHAFAGRGMARLLEHERGALLLERISPGHSLVELSRTDDVAAAGILASVLETMAPDAPPPHCPTVGDWGRGFDRYLAMGDTRIPQPLVVRAREVFAALCETQRVPRLLHGDLQHYNILFDEHRGWLAIDPKGIVGEREYELGAFLRNPGDQPKLFLDPAVIQRRIGQLSSAWPCDPTRVLQWAFAQAVLSAIWTVEDGAPWDDAVPVLLLAETIQRMPFAL